MKPLRWILDRIGRFYKPHDDRFDLLCVGLGNPGDKYARTRHNAGFLVVDALAGKLSRARSLACDTAKASVGTADTGKQLVLAKPQTFMNDSGRAVSELLASTGLSSAACLVIVDDLNIPFGKLRFRKNGSDGGHNGLKSVISTIGQDFPRLRVGIGPVTKGIPVIDFVLHEFLPEEASVLGEMVGRAADAVLFYMQNGIESAMGRYN